MNDCRRHLLFVSCRLNDDTIAYFGWVDRFGIVLILKFHLFVEQHGDDRSLGRLDFHMSGVDGCHGAEYVQEIRCLDRADRERARYDEQPHAGVCQSIDAQNHILIR